MQNYTFVLDTNKRQLDPVCPAIARKLLSNGEAAVFRRYPFTIILKRSVDTHVEPIKVKIDPGSKVTGLALLKGDKLIFAAELTHRGQTIKASLDSRRAIRRGRRARHTRYRQARFLNRTRPNGWLAPSLQHRVDTTLTIVNKFIKFAPVDSLAMELVRFDLQQLENPEISSVEYQQGELLGYEVREYLLNHGTCQMCRTDKFGFPSRYVPRDKFVKGFQTGDIVKAIVTSGKKIGEYVGRVAVRTSGSFNISAKELVQGIGSKYCQILHRKDGYSYSVLIV